MELGEKRRGVVWPSLPTTNPPLSLTGLPIATVTLSNSSPIILAGGSVYAVQEDALLPQFSQIQGNLLGLAKDEKGGLVVNEDNRLLRAENGEDGGNAKDLELAGGVVSVAASLQHCLALGPTGALFCRGVPPLLGNTSPSAEFVRVSLLEGLEVVQVAVGEDFSVVLARKRDPGVVTPEDGKVPSEPEELCPLGLQVGASSGEGLEDQSFKNPEKFSMDAHGTKIDDCEQVEKYTNSSDVIDVSGDTDKNLISTDDCVDGHEKRQKGSANSSSEAGEASLVGNFLQETLEESYKQMALLNDESTDLEEKGGIAENCPQSSQEDPYEDAGHPEVKEDETKNGETLEQKPDLAEICASVTASGSLEPFPNSLGYVAGLGRSLYSSLTRTSTSSLTTPPSSHQSSRSPSRTPSLTSSRGSTISLTGSQSGAVSSMSEAGERLGATLVFCWGQARRGQLGQGDMLVRPSPSLLTLPPLTTITKVAVGARHALALTACGEVWGWGDNSKGQLGPGMAALLHPTSVSLPKGETARDISCSTQASLVVMGSGRFLLLGVGGTSGARLQVLAPPLDPGLTPISGILLSSGGVAATVANQHPATLGLVQGEQTLLRSTRAMLALLQSLVPRGVEEGPLLKVRELLGTLHSILISCVFSSTPTPSNSTANSSMCTSLESAPHTGVLSNLQPLAAAFSALQVCFVHFYPLPFSIQGSVCNCVAMDCLMLDSEQQHLMPTIVEVIQHVFQVAITPKTLSPGNP